MPVNSKDKRYKGIDFQELFLNHHFLTAQT